MEFKTLQEIFRLTYSYTDFTSDYVFNKAHLKNLSKIFNDTPKFLRVFNFLSIFDSVSLENFYLYKIICKYVDTNTQFTNSINMHIPESIKNKFENNEFVFFNGDECYLTFVGLAAILTNKIYNIDLHQDRKELCNEVILFVFEAADAKKDDVAKLCICHANTKKSRHFNFKMLNLLDGKNANFSFEEHLTNKIKESATGIYVRRYENWDEDFNKDDFENLFDKFKNNGLISEYFINSSNNFELNKEIHNDSSIREKNIENIEKNIKNIKDFSKDMPENLSKWINEWASKIASKNPNISMSISSAIAVDENGNVIDLTKHLKDKGSFGPSPIDFDYCSDYSNNKDENNSKNCADDKIKEIIEDNSCLCYISYNSIIKKNMYYNDNIESDITNIQKLIKPSKYKSAIKELKLNKLASGISCMLYGEPGTGKTESVLQIARETKRNIIQVDLSQVESKWVGESSKNIQSIFNSYNEILEISKENKLNVPILLLNECDGFISKRLTEISGEAAKESNTGANIILENLEKFEGIIFLTTNLVNNLDDALDRRLLYKINLEKPDEKTRKKLWKSKINKLSMNTVELLAKEYKFSGAQIDNIFKKLIIDYIITTKKDYSYDTLKKYCDNEIAINKKDTGKPIGFC